MHDKIVATSEEGTALSLLYGYTQVYSRNLSEFAMSRAARKRGVKSTDSRYLRNLADQNKREAESLARKAARKAGDPNWWKAGTEVWKKGKAS